MRATTTRPYSLLDLRTVDTRSASADRPVLSRETALALAQRLLAMTQKHSVGVTIDHTVRTVTKVANGRVLNTDDGETITIAFRSQWGSGFPVQISTNQLNDATLDRVVAQATALAPSQFAKPKYEVEEVTPSYPDHPLWSMYNARPQQPVSLWHDTTARAMDTVRGEVLPALLAQVNASQLVGAATLGMTARSSCYVYTLGLTAFSQETDCEVTVTARLPDGTASGWSGQASRDWAQITPPAVVTQAIDIANRSRHMVALEPGRRVAILGPAAVGQLVRQMASFFSARAADTGLTPFSMDTPGRPNKIGLRVFDPRLRMVSDPADPDGGFPAFFEHDPSGLNVAGFPLSVVTWVDRGILTNLSNDIWYALDHGKAPSAPPDSVRLTTVPGTPTATLEEMIANCKEGVYVHRLSNISVLDQKTGMMTGVTRDGCFFVKNGKIDRPVKNFRFTDSPFFSFNNLEMIGVPERVAFGYSTPAMWGEPLRWPRLPVLVPPMMITDFNFSALSDAV